MHEAFGTFLHSLTHLCSGPSGICQRKKASINPKFILCITVAIFVGTHLFPKQVLQQNLLYLQTKICIPSLFIIIGAQNFFSEICSKETEQQILQALGIKYIQI